MKDKMVIKTRKAIAKENQVEPEDEINTWLTIGLTTPQLNQLLKESEVANVGTHDLVRLKLLTGHDITKRLREDKKRKYSKKVVWNEQDRLLHGLLWCYFHMEFSENCTLNKCDGCKVDIGTGLLPQLDHLIDLRRKELKRDGDYRVSKRSVKVKSN